MSDLCNACVDGARCDDCGERMCETYGPEPRVCSVTCADCPCDCTACLLQRQDLRAELEDYRERERLAEERRQEWFS